MSDNDFDTSGIAIVGMSGRFPGAASVAELWRNLCEGRESVTTLDDATLLAAGADPGALSDPSYVRTVPVLDGIDLFDAPLFDISPGEARLLDPQQRLFLECAWEALEQGGYRGAAGDLAVGVFAGASTSSYLLNNLWQLPAMRRGRSGINMSTLQLFVANDKDYLATRAAYKLDLRGPSFTVQSACSTSLLACHVACQALLARECDLALAGGAAVRVPQHLGYYREPGSIVSSDGHCRAFDARGDGTVFGSGVGVVLLRRLEDALAARDHVWAVIRGSAANNDGALKMGFTAPSVEAGARVIEEALQVAGAPPDSIGYVEAHGTGTHLGDPVEIAALTQAFRSGTRRKGFCAIGSIKTNIGHLETASGVAGLIKTASALHHEQIPASLHFETPNPQLDLENSPFFVNTALRPWPRGQATPRRAGVTSLGVGGTNVHMVLEEAPPRSPAAGTTRPWQLVTLSAHSPPSLEGATRQLADHLGERPAVALPDVAYTLNVGRAALRHRRVAVCRDADDARAVFSGAHPARLLSSTQEMLQTPVAFMFPGQGSQYVDMGRELLATEPTFAECLGACAETLRPILGRDIRPLIYPEPARREACAAELQETASTQPVLFAVEYALARTWMDRGVTPGVLLGHSVGELVAACLAGVFRLEDALALVALRGRLVQELPRGAMLSVALSAEEIAPYLGADLGVAAVNESGRCVISGTTAAVDGCARALAVRSIEHRRLHTSHAFHSAMLEPAVERFAAAVAEVPRAAPTLRCLSNVTGTWLTDAQAVDPGYWGQQLRRPVRFAEDLGAVLAEGPAMLLEVGPGRTLARFATAHALRRPEHAVVASLRHPSESGSDVAVFLGALGQLWLRGVPVRWSDHWRGEQRRREPLPTYCFDRKRHWIDPAPQARAAEESAEAAAERTSDASTERQPPPGAARPEVSTPFTAPRTATEAALARILGDVLGIGSVGVHDNFFELGGDSVLGVQVASKANELGLRLSPKHLFEHQCVADLAAAVDAGAVDAPAPQPEPQGPQPLLPIQSWLVERMPEFRGWSWILVLEARDPVDVPAMQDVLEALRRHHPALRTRFAMQGSRWVQEVLSEPPALPVTTLDLSEVDPAEFHARVDECARQACARIDVERGDVVTMTVVRGPRHAGKNDRVVLVAHHLVLDAEGAERVLSHDLQAAYGQRRRGEEIRLPPISTSPTQLAALLARRAGELAARPEAAEWVRPARAEVPRLPWRAPAGAPRCPADVRRHLVALDGADTAYLLGEFQRSRRVTLEEVTAGAVASALARWGGVRRLLLDVLTTSRQVDLPGVDLTRSIGWFTAIYPLHLELPHAAAPQEVLEATSRAMRQLRHREHEHGVLRHLSEPGPLRTRLEALPRADVYFEYGGSHERFELEREREIGDRPFRADPHATDSVFSMLGSFRYALEVVPYLSEGRLKILWLHDERALPADGVAELAHRCVQFLERLVASARGEAGTERSVVLVEAALGAVDLGDIVAELSQDDPTLDTGNNPQVKP